MAVFFFSSEILVLPVIDAGEVLFWHELNSGLAIRAPAPTADIFINFLRSIMVIGHLRANVNQLFYLYKMICED